MSHDITALRKFVSPEIVFGAGSRRSVANFASNFGARHVLLVSDPGVAAAGCDCRINPVAYSAVRSKMSNASDTGHIGSSSQEQYRAAGFVALRLTCWQQVGNLHARASARTRRRARYKPRPRCARTGASGAACCNVLGAARKPPQGFLGEATQPPTARQGSTAHGPACVVCCSDL